MQHCNALIFGRDDTGYALEKGCVRFDWTVDSTNGAAREFYRQLGTHVAPDKVYFRLSGPELERFVSASQNRRLSGG